jgi:hypothetical protein
MNAFLKHFLRLAAAGALLAGLAFLYLEAYRTDPAAAETARLVRELKQINANWNADVLRSRKGESKDYDAITTPQSTALQVLEHIGEQGLGRFGVRLEDAQVVLRQTIIEKSDLVDRFKRESAIMRNSLRYIPAATAELKAKAREAGEATPQKRAQLEALSTAAEQILQDATGLEGATDRAQARRLQIAVGRLAVNRSEYPQAVWESFDVFARHAAQIGIQKEREMETLETLGQVPLGEYIEALDAASSKAFSRADSERGFYQTGLYIYAGLLLALLAFLVVRAWRRGSPRLQQATSP